MTWGAGLGTLFGDVPLIPTDQPLSEVAGQAISFDFTDEPDGPLPGLWEAYRLDHDGLGDVQWIAEPLPSTYFHIVGGVGMWQYTRAPALPPPLTAFTERGYAIGPSGVTEGRNFRAAVIAQQPLLLVDDEHADEFVWSVGLALRVDPSRPRFVGARMRAHWQAGVWTTPLILEVIYVSGTGADEVVVASSVVPPAEPDLLNVWRNQPTAELEIELRGTVLVARVGGIIELIAAVPDDNYDSQVALLVSVFNRTAGVITPAPSILGASFQSLRDFANLGPPPQIPGALHLEAPDFPMMKLPIRELLDAGLIKQLRGRQFQFTQETEVAVQHQTFRFNEGEVIRIHERLGSQDFIPSTRDLHFERTRR